MDSEISSPTKVPWNKGKIVGQKRVPTNGGFVATRFEEFAAIWLNGNDHYTHKAEAPKTLGVACESTAPEGQANSNLARVGR